MKKHNGTMAPCIDDRLEQDDYLTSTTPLRTVVSAVNYEVSMVDQFLAHETKQRRCSVETVPHFTEELRSLTKRFHSNLENDVPERSFPNCMKRDKMNEAEDESSESNDTTGERHSSGAQGNPGGGLDKRCCTPDQRIRKSARERTKKVPLARSRVRYDMQLVPSAKKNRAFLKQLLEIRPHPPARRSSRLTLSIEGPSMGADKPGCNVCELTLLDPFEDGNSSVIWIPTKRSEWEDSVLEMTAVCTSAAFRRQLSSPARHLNTTKPFHAPLSRDYIRDRVDIDDPLNGYQIRHREGGWLQGFVLWTNFTTWTHYFKWDSQHPDSGFDPSSAEGAVDVTGELANALEALPRSGDPHGEGIVFDSIAEIALLGGLGCGEYLLRMALEDIQKSGKYKYVVLQATDSSKTFYERFGFSRVGAVCRYQKGIGEVDSAPIMGYRHWTHANESERSLQKHGGPSYMMCLKLSEHFNDLPSLCSCGRRRDPSKSNFMDRMLELLVPDKPTIEPLGNASTPFRSAVRRSSSACTGSESPTPSKHTSQSGLITSITPRKRGRPKGSKNTSFSLTTPRRKSQGGILVLASNPNQRETSIEKEKEKPPSGTRMAIDVNDCDIPPNKRRRRDDSQCCEQKDSTDVRSSLLSPPKVGSTLTYAQKQYHSVWLAVPPSSVQAKGSRPPPRRRRSSVESESDPVTSQSNDAPVKKTRKVAKAGESVQLDTHPVENLVINKREKKAINKSVLFKQKVKAYPRSRVHYYNRVVKRKDSGVEKYYFVLQYDEETGLIKIVPMTAKGKLTGKREGRPRYQADIGDTDENFIVGPADDYVVVPASMVMKTPIVASEAWDIKDDF